MNRLPDVARLRRRRFYLRANNPSVGANRLEGGKVRPAIAEAVRIGAWWRDRAYFGR